MVPGTIALAVLGEKVNPRLTHGSLVGSSILG